MRWVCSYACSSGRTYVLSKTGKTGLQDLETSTLSTAFSRVSFIVMRYVALLQNGTTRTSRKLDPFKALEMRLQKEQKAIDADLNKKR